MQMKALTTFSGQDLSKNGKTGASLEPPRSAV